MEIFKRRSRMCGTTSIHLSGGNSQIDIYTMHLLYWKPLTFGLQLRETLEQISRRHFENFLSDVESGIVMQPSSTKVITLADMSWCSAPECVNFLILKRSQNLSTIWFSLMFLKFLIFSKFSFNIFINKCA